MAKELDSFLGDLANAPEDNVFDTSKAESIDGFDTPLEEVTEETEQTLDEKAEPFHKNPKIKRFIEKEVSKALKSTGSERERFVEETKEDGDSDDLTDVLSRIIGNDTPEKLSAIKDFRKAIASSEERAVARAARQYDDREQQVQALEREADESLDDAFDSIEETYGVDISSNSPLARKTRNEFIEFVQRVAPKDSNGDIKEYPDLTETFEVFQEMNKRSPAPSNNRAKELASRGIARSTETQSAGPAKRITWDTVDRMNERLSN